MSSVEYLRGFINERLTAAAEEILGVFEKTIVEYEEEIDRQRRLLESRKPELTLLTIELPQQHVCMEEEVVADQQLCIEERSSSVDQEDPEPPEIKEEEEAVHVTRMNRQEIQDAVLSSLPCLTDETLTSLLEGLEELGIESGNDLQLLQEKDLEKYLKPIQCRKLVHDWKHKEHSPVESHSEAVASLPLSMNFSLTPSIPTPSTQSTQEMSVAALPSSPWHTNFRVDWDRMPVGMRIAVLSLKRPSPEERRQMVKVVVDQMREHDLNPSRAVCHNIVRGIIKEFPRSFADVDQNGEFVGDGCSSLLMQIKARVEYKNRNSKLARRRRERRSKSQGENLSRGPVDQYGCVRWGPLDLPPGETEVTLEEIRRQMVTLHSEEGMDGVEKAVKLLEKTYAILRRYLNMTPPPAILDVKKQWPYLLTQRGMFSHFLQLTDISILAKLQEAIERKGDLILKFCLKLNKNTGVEEVLANYEPNTSQDKAMCIILLLQAYFKEATDAIILQADPLATAADIQRTLNLPSTPRLIVSGLKGEVMKPRAWMLSIEGQVVMGPHASFINGIAALFACYYNFNLQYPEEASCTLEFIQRWFVGINPEKGSKAKKQRAGMNPHVCTLMRKLMDLEWIFV